MEDPSLAKQIKKQTTQKSDIPKGPQTSSPMKKRATTIGPNQNNK